MSERLSAPVAPKTRARWAHPSSMSQRLGWVHRLLSRWAFAYVHVDPRFVERVKDLARRGSVVYVMNHRSVADYLLVNAVFWREGLPLPDFSNSVPMGWFRSIRWIAGRIGWRLSRGQLLGHRARTEEDRGYARDLVREGQSILLFMRARASGMRRLFGRRWAVETQRVGDEFLEDVLRLARDGERDVFIVPVAPFRGRGYRRRPSRLATVVYSVHQTPTDPKKLVSFLFNRRDLALTIGEEIPLSAFLEKYGHENDERLLRRLTRALHLFLYREERVVWGPPLLPKEAVREVVLDSPELRDLVRRIAAERGVSAARVEAEAQRYFDEIAANFNGAWFAIVTFVFRRIWNRIFRGVEITGLDRVAERLHQHPVVLVPCHRSHFDYLILSYIFHGQFLSPPHIAAGINLSFFPLGMLFRGCGAYFIRRTFDDNELYKVVFRQYLTWLIREGYTQEFFIEGGRSRTGKILTPRLGMLSAIINAFLHGVRRDLYLVPVSITYERLVEEEAYKSELLGEEKKRESLGALVSARSVLRRNYGKAYVNFAEPISLNETLGELRDRFREGTAEAEAEKRRFILKLGFRLLGEVNAASVVTAPSIAATVLLSHSWPAIRYPDFLRAAHLLLDHARAEGTSFTDSLEQDRQTFHETLGFLQGSGLVTSIRDGEGEILHVPDDKRVNLDFYKNNSIHLFVLLSLLSHSLARDVGQDRLKEELWWWLDLFRNEFVLPEREALAAHVGELLERFRQLGILENGRTNADHLLVRSTTALLQSFREAYWIAVKVARGLDGDGASQRVLLDEMRRIYRANLLLGVLRKPEGNSTVTFENALRRLEEMGYLSMERRGRGGRERWIVRGPAHDRLAGIEKRLTASVTPTGA